MSDNTKDKEMASMLKDKGVARHSMRCPVCGSTITSNARVTPSENNRKGFSHYDFAGALHSHFQRCGN